MPTAIRVRMQSAALFSVLVNGLVIKVVTTATGTFAHGDTPGLVDICIVPQVFNAQRYECDMTRYPTITRIFDACMKLEAFDSAQPSKQPD